MHLSRSGYLFVLALTSLCAALSGCTLATTSPVDPISTPASVPGQAISGTAFGGSQAISGAYVYLLAANPAGYGSPSLSLLTSSATGNAVTSVGSYVLSGNGTGSFNITSAYDCTKGYAQGASTSTGAITLSGSEQVYLYIQGGNAGAGTNSGIGLIAALGPCNAPYATSINVNEVTTVAAAYAFAGYATDVLHLSSSGTALALTGLSNAGLNSANLASIHTGYPVASTTSITRPVSTLLTLGNILAACVDSSSTQFSNCNTLFKYTRSNGATGSSVSETASAAMNLAHNPWPTQAGMDALFGLVPSTGAPYGGGLSAEPNDFTLSLNYTGGGLDTQPSIAIDSAGNAWVANFNTNSVSKFSSTGTPATSSTTYIGGGISNPNSIAIDASGNVWTVNLGNYTLAELSSTGAPVSPSTGYRGGGINQPQFLAIDGSGNVWTANAGNNSVSKFSSTGSPISPANTGYAVGGINDPNGIGIDAAGNVWTANAGNNSAGVRTISKLTNAGVAISPSTGFTAGSLVFPFGLAIDATGNAWTVDYSGPSIYELNASGTLTSPSTGYTGGGLGQSASIALDGVGNVWTTNASNSSISAFSNTGTPLSPATGYVGTSVNRPFSLAIDGSGDIWVANSSNKSLTEFIGIAVPVVTPTAATLTSPYNAALARP